MIYQCIVNTWSPKIGDPFLLAWIITAGYFLAAILSFSVSQRITKYYSAPGKAWAFWLGLTVMMVFLGLNKQLDLQTFLHSSLKCLSIVEGWYNQRRIFQLDFVIAIAAVFAVLVVFIISFFREILRKDTLAVTGIIFLLVFILIHASYFNYFEMPAITEFYEAGLNWLLEITGIALICLQSLLRLKKGRN